MFLRQHDNCVGKDADDDGRHARQSVCDETHDAREPTVAEFRQINSASDAERQADDGSEREQNQRADNRIADAAAFADGLRRVNQKMEIDCRHAAICDVAENQHENRDGQKSAESRQARHDLVRQLATTVLS